MSSSPGATSQLSTRLLWIAFISGAFGLAMTAQINFLVPLRARELGASFDIIGIIVGAGALAPALLSVPLGSVIDRLGPRRSFLVGTASAAVLALMFVFVTNYWWFLVLQPLLGLARNLGWVASQSYVTSLGTAEQRPGYTGRFSFFSNGGQMLGPVMVGGVAQLFGFQWAFVFVAGYAAVFAVTGLLLAETRTPDQAPAKQGTGVRSALELLKLRGIRVVLLFSFGRLWTTWVYTTFFPVYLVDQGIEPGVVGTVMAASGVVATALAPTAGFLGRRLQEQTVTAIALGAAAGGLLLAPHVSTLPLVYAVPMLVGVGQGLSLPMLISMITGAAPTDQRGVALGLRAMVNQTAATAAPFVIGPLIAGLGILLGFTTGGAVSVVLVASARLLHARSPRVRGDDTSETQPRDSSGTAAARPEGAPPDSQDPTS